MKLDNPLDILPTIKKMNYSKGENKLIKRISSLIKDCAPPGAFKGEPSYRDMWKFIRNVMEKYIILKKNNNNIIIGKIQGCLGIRENENVLQEVMKIYNSLSFMVTLLNKLFIKCLLFKDNLYFLYN